MSKCDNLVNLALEQRICLTNGISVASVLVKNLPNSNTRLFCVPCRYEISDHVSNFNAHFRSRNHSQWLNTLTLEQYNERYAEMDSIGRIQTYNTPSQTPLQNSQPHQITRKKMKEKEAKQPEPQKMTKKQRRLLYTLRDMVNPVANITGNAHLNEVKLLLEKATQLENAIASAATASVPNVQLEIEENRAPVWRVTTKAAPQLACGPPEFPAMGTNNTLPYHGYMSPFSTVSTHSSASFQPSFQGNTPPYLTGNTFQGQPKTFCLPTASPNLQQTFAPNWGNNPSPFQVEAPQGQQKTFYLPAAIPQLQQTVSHSPSTSQPPFQGGPTRSTSQGLQVGQQKKFSPPVAPNLQQTPLLQQRASASFQSPFQGGQYPTRSTSQSLQAGLQNQFCLPNAAPKLEPTELAPWGNSSSAKPSSHQPYQPKSDASLADNLALSQGMMPYQQYSKYCPSETLPPPPETPIVSSRTQMVLPFHESSKDTTLQQSLNDFSGKTESQSANRSRFSPQRKWSDDFSRRSRSPQATMSPDREWPQRQRVLENKQPSNDLPTENQQSTTEDHGGMKAESATEKELSATGGDHDNTKKQKIRDLNGAFRKRYKWLLSRGMSKSEAFLKCQEPMSNHFLPDWNKKGRQDRSPSPQARISPQRQRMPSIDLPKDTQSQPANSSRFSPRSVSRRSSEEKISPDRERKFPERQRILENRESSNDLPKETQIQSSTEDGKKTESATEEALLATGKEHSPKPRRIRIRKMNGASRRRYKWLLSKGMAKEEALIKCKEPMSNFSQQGCNQKVQQDDRSRSPKTQRSIDYTKDIQSHSAHGSRSSPQWSDGFSTDNRSESPQEMSPDGEICWNDCSSDTESEYESRQWSNEFSRDNRSQGRISSDRQRINDQQSSNHPREIQNQCEYTRRSRFSPQRQSDRISIHNRSRSPPRRSSNDSRRRTRSPHREPRSRSPQRGRMSSSNDVRRGTRSPHREPRSRSRHKGRMSSSNDVRRGTRSPYKETSSSRGKWSRSPPRRGTSRYGQSRSRSSRESPPRSRSRHGEPRPSNYDQMPVRKREKDCKPQNNTRAHKDHPEETRRSNSKSAPRCQDDSRMHLSKDLSPKTKILAVFPEEVPQAKVLRRLEFQNAGLSCKEWKILRSVVDEKGYQMEIAIDNASRIVFEKVQYRAYYVDTRLRFKLLDGK